MSLSNILQVALGLMLVYYALGLIINILTTIIKDVLDMRAEALEKVLKKFIETDETGKKIFADFQKHPLIQQITPIADKALQYTNRGEGNRKVSEIPSDVFSLALLDVLASQARPIIVREAIEELVRLTPDGELKEKLRALQNDPDDVLLEQLYAIVRPLPDGEVKKKLEKLIDLFLGKPEDQLDMIREGIKRLPAGNTQNMLLGLVNFSKSNVDDWRRGLEARYDNMMKNFALLYAQRVRKFVVLFALLVTVVVGADSIQIAQDLWMEPARQEAMVEALSPLREQFGAQAVEWNTDESLTDEEREQRIEKGVGDLISIVERLQSVEDVSITWKGWPWNRANWEGGLGGVLLKVVGLTLTWLAASQGSSFWYDMMKRINPRSATSAPSTTSAGSPPATGTES